jgi:hypothetical protein
MGRVLLPLRIPAGWAVVFNILVDLPTDMGISKNDADSYLSEDILSIEQLKLAGNKWATDPDGVLIDVSWTIPGNPDGEYLLSVVQGDWNGAKAEFRHRQGLHIKAAIERVFAELTAGRTVVQIAEIFNKMQEGDANVLPGDE